MTRDKKHALVLICLSVLLLYLVSARIGQKAMLESGVVLEKPAPSQVESELPPKAEVPPVASPVVTEEPKLPEVDLSSWELELVNNTHVLSSSFAPNVTEIENGQYFDSRAVDAFNGFVTAAREAGYDLCIRAAYRPYSTQAYIFYGKASGIAWDGTVEYAKAEEMARKIVAYPGTSDHQLGLSADIMDKAETSMVADDVRDMPLLVWLRENCADHGFILRYPQDKKEITGWDEPWHFRYVGKEAAAYIMENELCLEEFIQLYY